MNLGTLTTTQAIRAVLGVSEDSDELPDQIFTDLEISDQIELIIEQWLPISIASVSLASKAGKALRSAAKYTGALILLPSLTTSTAALLSDGQDQFRRQDRDLKEMEKALRRNLDDMIEIILDELVTDYTNQPSFMGRSSPNFDPVLGV